MYYKKQGITVFVAFKNRACLAPKYDILFVLFIIIVRTILFKCSSGVPSIVHPKQKIIG